MKLLVVDLKEPQNSQYMKVNDLDSWMNGKALKNYMFAKVSESGYSQQITLNEYTPTPLKHQILNQLLF
jgi:hypothetical protein